MSSCKRGDDRRPMPTFSSLVRSTLTDERIRLDLHTISSGGRVWVPVPQCLQRVLAGKVAMRCCAVGMHSALLRSRRQHSFIASLPADEQHAVSRLYSGSGVDAKPTVKRIAIQVRRCTS